MNYQSEVNFFGGLKSDGYMDMWRWLYLDTAHKLSGQFLTTDNSAPSHKSKPQLLNLNSISLSVSKTLPVHFFSPVWFAFPQKQTLLRTHIPHYWWEPPFKYIKEKTHTRSNNGSGSDREELGFNLELTEIEKTLSAKSAPTKVQKLQQKASRVWSSPIRLNTITSLIFWSKPNAMQWQHPILPFLLVPAPIPAPHIYKIHFLSFNAYIMLKARCKQNAEFSSQAIRVPHSSWTVPKNSTCFVGFLYGPSSPIWSTINTMTFSFKLGTETLCFMGSWWSGTACQIRRREYFKTFSSDRFR